MLNDLSNPKLAVPISFIEIRKKLPCLALIMLFGQVLALLFCGDIDCLQGEGDEVCQTLLCSLLATHGHSQLSLDFGKDDSCQCACHIAIDFQHANFFSVSLVATPSPLVEPQLFLSTPNSRIDHIPRA